MALVKYFAFLFFFFGGGESRFSSRPRNGRHRKVLHSTEEYWRKSNTTTTPCWSFFSSIICPEAKSKRRGRIKKSEDSMVRGEVEEEERSEEIRNCAERKWLKRREKKWWEKRGERHNGRGKKSSINEGDERLTASELQGKTYWIQT